MSKIKLLHLPREVKKNGFVIDNGHKCEVFLVTYKVRKWYLLWLPKTEEEIIYIPENQSDEWLNSLIPRIGKWQEK